MKAMLSGDEALLVFQCVSPLSLTWTCTKLKTLLYSVVRSFVITSITIFQDVKDLLGHA